MSDQCEMCEVLKAKQEANGRVLRKAMEGYQGEIERLEKLALELGAFTCSICHLVRHEDDQSVTLERLPDHVVCKRCERGML